jgi:CRISPR-associated endonuclease/helicase Cas3
MSNVTRPYKRVDHSSAGAHYIYSRLANRGERDSFLGEVLAICLASHHSGLIDAIKPDGTNSLSERLALKETRTHLDEVTQKLPTAIREKLDSLLNTAHSFENFHRLIERILESEHGNLSQNFQIGLLVKFLFSCLIDADRSDTADFENPARLLIANNQNIPDWLELERRLDSQLSKFNVINHVDKIRADISHDCFLAGARRRGIYFLTVPTGGGKTLASLRFALRHAQEHHLNRIFYVIPYTSIIDQNAETVRRIMENAYYGDDLRDRIVLEHHSNLTPNEETSRQKILAENWDAPIVFTTSVQFLESLFGHGTRGIRRMHQLANSVIVFDEVQTLPVRCVHLFNNAINFLVEYCGSTAVMCTATQPLLHDVDKKQGALRPIDHPGIVRDTQKLFIDLKRVEVIDARKPGGWTIEELADLAPKEQTESTSLLVVTNTKRAARELYRAITSKTEIETYHLSTGMCPAHRRRILHHIRWLLRRNKQVICISTQLIEAGVDVDFGTVIRFMAGLDSIAQAAGRCNRNGRRKTGKVIVVNPASENLDMLPDIKIGRDCAETVFWEYDNDAAAFGHDRIGPAAIKRYFELYFYQRQNEMNYPIKRNSPIGHDDNLLNLLSINSTAVADYSQAHDGTYPETRIWQSFMSASKTFEAIDSPTQGIIVPYREGKDVINSLLSSSDPNRMRELLRKAQQYSVNVFEHTQKTLRDSGALHEIADYGVLYLDPGYYDTSFGLREEGGGKLEAYVS